MAVKDDRWSVTTLRDCADWYSGGTPSTSVPDYWNGDIPWITASSLHDFYIKDSERRVTPLGVANGTRLMPKDTILFVVRGMSLKTEFRVGITRRPMAFGQDCKALVAKDGVDPLFLANVLRAKAEEILGFVDEASHGTGRLATDAIQNLEILLPPLDEQKAIAHILGTLDDKIELNQQMNHTLESIARALFKSWFIDFDPVRAKLDGRQPAGMDAETAALFPAEFEDSALGKIPKGWEIKTSQSIFSVKDGTHDSPKVAEVGYHLVTSKHLKDGYIDFDNTYLISEEDFNKANRRSKVDKNDILITMIGTVGNILFVDYKEINFAIKNVGLFKTSEKPELSEYFYYYLRSSNIENYLRVRQSGTTQSYITLITLRTLPVLLPPLEIIRVFRQNVLAALQKITANREESRSLAYTRDALLPRLLSGEIPVKDAEKVVEEVT